MPILLRRILHLERASLQLKAEISRKDQEIMALIDDKADLMRRYSNLLDQCTMEEIA